MKKFNLKQESQDWFESGIITEDQKDQILNHHQSKYNSTKELGNKENIIYLIYLLAGLCMSLGVITLISYNWSFFGTPVRILIGLLPLVLSAILCIYTQVKNTSKAFNNFAIIVNIGSVMASIALISQILHINGNFFNYSAIVAMLILPMYIVYRSNITILAFSLLTTSMLISIIDSYLVGTLLDIILLLLFMIINIGFIGAIYFSTKRNFNIENNFIKLIHVVVALNIALYILYNFNQPFNLLYYIAIIRIYEFIIYKLNQKHRLGDTTLILRRALMAFTITAGFISVYDSDVTIAALVVLAIASLFGSRRTYKSLYQMSYISLLAYAILIFFNISYPLDIIIISLLIFYVIVALRDKSYAMGIYVFNAASAYIIIKFIVSDSNLMLKAILLILSSIAMLVVNKLLRRKKSE